MTSPVVIHRIYSSFEVGAPAKDAIKQTAGSGIQFHAPALQGAAEVPLARAGRPRGTGSPWGEWSGGNVTTVTGLGWNAIPYGLPP